MILYCSERRMENGKRIVDVIVDGGKAKLFLVENTSWGKPVFTVYLLRKGKSAWGNASYIDGERLFDAKTIAEAKRKIAKYIANNPGLLEEDEPETANVAYLPAGDGKDFYPTPDNLAGKLIAGVDWKGVKEILEPSAGKGDLVEAVQKMTEQYKYCETVRGASKGGKKEFDVVELDYNLRLILRGKGMRLVGDDFLEFRTNKRYDLIIMNPPFSEGAKHLLHAIELQKEGGQIACLLNAETIRNPYTNERKLLKSLLAKYEARIEFVQNAFADAQRKTGVEVAVIHLNIPKTARVESNIFEGARKAEEQDFENIRKDDGQMVIADDILSLIEYFNVEARAGIEFMKTYDALMPHIMAGEDGYGALIELVVGKSTFRGMTNEIVNNYLRSLRLKYWNLLLDRPQLREKMTSQMQADYHSKVTEMAEYDFNKHNVMQVFYDIQIQLQQGIEDSIMKLFSKLSEEHSWSREVQNDNIHYFNGWATNKAWKVGMKVILPINGFRSFGWSAEKLDEYDIVKTISDMERSLTYLDKGEIGWQRDPYNVIHMANELGNQRAELDFTYFTVKFYKKGTCHIKFRKEAEPIVDRLNIYAARQRNWLPPSYGRKKYRDMDEKERAVIDDFQGEAEYEKVMANPGMYVIEAAQMTPLLAG